MPAVPAPPSPTPSAPRSRVAPRVALGLLVAATAGCGLLAWRAVEARTAPDVAALATLVVAGAAAASAAAARGARLAAARLADAERRDLAERRRADEALRDSEARFRAVFEFAGLGVLLVGVDGRIVEANRAMRDLSGYGVAELRGMPVSDLHEPGAETASASLLRRAAAGEVERVEESRRLRRKDGVLRDVFVRGSALRGEGGALRYAIVLVEDVSDKKRLEAQLLLADRMASVGTLAAGVAHEINNPLSFILSNLDFALEEVRESQAGAGVRRALADARDGAIRVREIVRDLRTFARAGDGVRETLDVRRVLQSAIGLASNEIRHRAALVVDPGEVPPVVASEHRLAQVFLNLLINAAQAIPEGRSAENTVRATTGTAPDGSAVIEISDTGAGIAPDVLPRIFDPFFTTKPVGVGTGLGLSICHGIVAELGGEISVESAPGEGATFRVRLPTTRAASRVGVTAAAPVPAARRGRILVVDDELLVGRAVARVLAVDHEVVAHTSGRDALAALAARPGAFDVVLCDLMMPEMSGMQLHARLAELAPALAARTVFLTGGAFTSAAREFLDRVPNPRLEKPFEPRALRELVARVLRAADAAPAGA